MKNSMAANILTDKPATTELGATHLVMLGFAQGQKTPYGFKTELVMNGRRMGRMECRVQRLCDGKCHAEVVLTADTTFDPLLVEVVDLQPVPKG